MTRTFHVIMGRTGSLERDGCKSVCHLSLSFMSIEINFVVLGPEMNKYSFFFSFDNLAIIIML